ncbi:putative uncharacterized protein DDB_G0290521 isoform X2 [Pseudophryne corroboree]|uniref:putative uncharacterized protein DDB_G0290521 isoform X2 n=1 Tax=Pseudophryne corroboree TaxID=495146 RepID=UPI003081D41C
MDDQKCTVMLSACRREKADIVFLQETHFAGTHSQLHVRKRSSTARPHPTLPRDADAGDARNPPPLRRPSQGSDPQHRRTTKRRRLEAESPAASSPPQRRISIVSALPPQAILASPQSEDPQSPQLSEPSILAEDAQQESDQQDTYTLHLQAIDPTQTTTPQDIPQPPQTSHSPQLSTTPPQPQMAPEFWSSWATQQAQHYACLNTHTQYLASLPHHLPRLSRNSGRLIVQVGRIANSMEQMREDNTQMQANLQRIMDEQQLQQQAIIQLIQHNQMINENLSRIIASNTAANSQLTASLNNLSQSLNVLASHQLSSSSGTTTPSQTPVNSPVRRSSRTRTNEPGQSSAPSTHTKK